MRKRWGIIIAVLNIMIIFLMGAAWQLNAKVAPDQIDIYVRYGEEHANQDGGTSQLFWLDGEEGFSEDHSMMCNINKVECMSGFLFRNSIWRRRVFGWILL